MTWFKVLFCIIPLICSAPWVAQGDFLALPGALAYFQERISANSFPPGIT